MRKIKWWIWAAVVFGWIAAADGYQHGNGTTAWLIGILIIVVAYYGEKLTQDK